MKKINIRINRSDSLGLFHDTRNDVKLLAKMVNLLIDKVNELVEENNKLKNNHNAQECDATQAS